MRRSKPQVTFIVEVTNTGFSAYCKEYAICTTGGTFAELKYNILEATNFHFEDDNISIEWDDIDLEVDLPQFFEHYRVINAKFLAERIGMNASLLSQYVTGRKKPSRKQVQRIVDGVHEIGRELMEIKFIVK